MAIRRTKKATKISTQDYKQRADNKALEKRIAQVRSLMQPKSPEHLNRLKDCIEEIHRTIEANQSAVETFGCPIRVLPVSNTGKTGSSTPIEHIPFDFQRRVATFVINEQKWMPLHEIRIEEIRNGIATLIDPSKVERKYIVEQRYPWPDSYTGLEISTDGYLPAALLFFYVLPLQFRVCLISAIATKEPFASYYKIGPNKLIYNVYDLRNNGLLEKFRQRVIAEINAFSENYKTYIEARVEYIERELQC